jgi:hypothetical protein
LASGSPAQIFEVTTMRGLLVSAFAAGLAALILAAPKPASALPAAAALSYGHAGTGMVQEARYWKRGRYYRHYRPYRYYRPRYHYRPYRWYYGPYAYPYYWWRPGVSIWFGW